jgi:hypothetical protein
MAATWTNLCQRRLPTPRLAKVRFDLRPLARSQSRKIEIGIAKHFYPVLVIRLSALLSLSTMTGMKYGTTVRNSKTRRARRKPKPIVYGAGWGRWIMRNVVRDLRSGALRVNAEGTTLH